MKKGKKVVLAQPVVAASSPLSRAARPVHGGVGGGGEAYRARLRYQSLLQDYQELVKVGSWNPLFLLWLVCVI